MKKVIILLGFLLSAGILPSLDAQTRVMTSHDIFDLSYVTETKISPSGTHIAYQILEQRPLAEGKGAPSTHLYVHNLGEGTTKAYMKGAHYLSGISWSADGSRVLFRARLGEEKQTGVYAIDLNGGAAYPLTKLPWSVNGYALSPDGRTLLLTSEGPDEGYPGKIKGFDQEIYEEDIRPVNLYSYDISAATARQLTTDITVSDFAWSPDGKRIAALVQEQNLTDMHYMFRELVLVNPESGERSPLVERHGKMGNISWSPDGKYIAFVSASSVNDPVAGSVYVIPSEGLPKRFSLLENLVKGMELSVTHVSWIDRNTIVFSAEVGVNTTLRAMNMNGGKQQLLLEGGKVVFGDFDVSGSSLVFAGNSITHPNELFHFDAGTRQLRKLTDSNPWLSGISMGTQEAISYKARDGLRIEGVLIYPTDYTPGTRYPLICLIHGGPEASIANGWQTYYSRWGQVAAGKGFFVFMPNYRGSSGRGVKFSQMDFGDLGDEEFLDVLDGITHLDKAGLIDKSRVGIGGGSYGGYFAALGATRYSEHFAASVMFVGISNQVSKRYTTDIPWEDYYVHWGYWTKDRFEDVYKSSPVAYLDMNRTPTLILHGDSDPRVHPSQSLEMYRGLKMHGKAPVRLVWYPGEGHGNRQNPARLDYSLRTLAWFEYYLKGDNPRDLMPPKDLDYKLDR